MKEYKYFNISSAEKEKLAELINETLQARPEVVFAYLYGSFTDKEERPVRDIDVAVYVASEKEIDDMLEYTAGLVLEMKKKGISVPLDIQVINTAPLGFLHHILSTGKILFCRNEELLTDLIEKTTHRYFQALPFIKSYLKETIS